MGATVSIAGTNLRVALDPGSHCRKPRCDANELTQITDDGSSLIRLLAVGSELS